jgi:hypothetical protein
MLALDASTMIRFLVDGPTIVQSGHVSHCSPPVFRARYDAQAAVVAAALYTFWPPILSMHTPSECSSALTKEVAKTEIARITDEARMIAKVAIGLKLKLIEVKE